MEKQTPPEKPCFFERNRAHSEGERFYAAPPNLSRICQRVENQPWDYVLLGYVLKVSTLMPVSPHFLVASALTLCAYDILLSFGQEVRTDFGSLTQF
jgi:hypothetical protein